MAKAPNIENPAQQPIKVSKPVVIGLSVASVLCAFLCNHFGTVCAKTGGWIGFILDFDKGSNLLLKHLTNKPFSFSSDFDSLLFTFIGIFLPWAIWLCIMASTKRAYMPGAEHGTARWGTPEESAEFADLEHPDNNIILSGRDKIALVPPKFNIKTDRNKNILLIGGPGSGKTRYNIKPNMMQLNASFVITDPKGTLLPECGTLFAGDGKSPVPTECMYTCPKDLYSYTRDPKTGKVTRSKEPIHKKGDKVPYKIKVLNLIDFDKSMGYNPFSYIHCETDVLKVVNVFMANTNGEGEKAKEDFWVKAERLLYNALFYYIYSQYPPQDRNFSTVCDLLGAAEAKEDDEDYKSPLDIMFEELETGMDYSVEAGEWVESNRSPDPTNFAVRQYKKFKMAAGKTLKSILISCAARLAMFDSDTVRQALMKDELELDRIGDEPTALFLIISDTDTTFRFIASMVIYQLFDQLVVHADNDCHGKLQLPVMCLLDEFANIGTLPDFDKTITTLRSRNISCEVVLQNVGQLENNYDKAARIIKGGCDTTVYLGTNDQATGKEISEQIGNATIAYRNDSKTFSQQNSTSTSDQLIQRPLMTPDEVLKMPRTQSLVMISGTCPFKSPKFKLEDHPRYMYIDPENHMPGHDAAYDREFDATAYIKQTRLEREAELRRRAEAKKEARRAAMKARHRANAHNMQKPKLFVSTASASTVSAPAVSAAGDAGSSSPASDAATSATSGAGVE